MRGVSSGDQVSDGVDDGELDIGSLGRAIMDRKAWIVGGTLASLAAAAVFVTVVKPRYTAEAKVIVENQENYYTRPTAATGGDPQALNIDAEAVASQVQLFTSRELAREAIKALDLKGNPEFDPASGGAGLLSGLGGLFGSRSAAEGGAPEDRMLENFFDRLNVASVPKSRVIQVEFTSRAPDLAARGANKIADLYIARQSDAKRENARAAATSLGTLIADLRTKVAQAESKAEEFRAGAGLTIGANNITMNGQQLSDLNAQMTVARSAQAEAQAKARALRDLLKQGRLGDVSEVAANELTRRLTEQRATLRAQIASESRTLMPGHPRIKELSAQVAELDSEIRSAVERVMRSLENDVRVAGSRVENLQAAINQQKKSVGGSSADEATARQLDREARLLKDQLEASVARYQDAMARENSESTPGDARIISRAIAPLLPSFPKKAPILVFAGFAGFLLSLGIVISAELMSGRAYAPSGVGPALAGPGGDTGRDEPVFAAPTLTAARGARPRRERAARTGAADVSGAIAGLAARLAATPAGDYAQRIVIASEAGEVPAGEVALALGRALARDRRGILVCLAPVGGGLDRPPGFADLMAETASFEDAINRDADSRLHVISAGEGVIAYGEPCAELLDALSRTYQFLVILTPPLQSDELALDLAPDADCAVLACAGEPDPVALDELRQSGAGEVTPVTIRSTWSARSVA